MTPIREITIREYMPGSYEVESERRHYSCSSREQLWLYLRRELGAISDPDDLDKIQDLEHEVDYLKEVSPRV